MASYKKTKNSNKNISENISPKNSPSSRISAGKNRPQIFSHKLVKHLNHQQNLDERTFKAIRKIDNHHKISYSLKFICYAIIAGAILVYIASFLQESANIKVVKDIKNKAQLFEVEKIMINPRIVLMDEENSAYLVKAKIARHLSNQEFQLNEVYAEGAIGKISAGELKIEDGGNHLIFSKNPVLILNQTEK